VEVRWESSEVELTDVVIKENGGASWMQVLEPSKVVNLTVDYDPLNGARMNVWLNPIQKSSFLRGRRLCCVS
jgi:hypothetical protein